jgi:hypothetical protein
MVRNFVRTCDMCHREIPVGKYLQRNAGKEDPDILMVLLENEGRDLQLIELPDGRIGIDTCMNCYSRMGISSSQSLN